MRVSKYYTPFFFTKMGEILLPFQAIWLNGEKPALNGLGSIFLEDYLIKKPSLFEGRRFFVRRSLKDQAR